MEIAAFVISIVALIPTGISIFIAVRANKSANSAVKAQHFLQIRQDLADVISRKTDRAQQYEKEESESNWRAWAVEIESYLNIYNDACALYLDGDLDSKRFKRSYRQDIERMINTYREPENPYKEFLKGEEFGKFPYIWKAYKKWLSSD